MTQIPAKDLQRITKLHSVLCSQATAGERANAWTALDELLSKHRRGWNDLLELIVEAAQAEKTAHIPAEDEGSDDVNETSGERAPPALDLVHRILEHYVALESHEYVAVALWILHAHIYDQFMHSPRLALTSPVRGCGKTILLSIIEKLVPRAHRTDSITPAAIYRLIDRDRCTMLIDEADNAGLLVNGELRAVINAGHRKGGSRSVSLKDGVRTYRVYGPMAIAAIGALPLPISHRSILVHMTRYAGDPLRRFDDSDTVELDEIFHQIFDWKRKLNIHADPAMPEALQNRQADNWRPLIAIADGFGADWGRAARDAALAFTRGYRDEDIGVVLLRDIRDLFDTHGADSLHQCAACRGSERSRRRPVGGVARGSRRPGAAAVLRGRTRKTSRFVPHPAALGLAAPAEWRQQVCQGLPARAV